MMRYWRSILGGLLGVQKRGVYEQDCARKSPLTLIIGGLLAALCFVLILMLIVRCVLYYAGTLSSI